MKTTRKKSLSRRSSFKCFAIQWLEETSTDLSATSVAKYRNIVELYLLPQFGKRRIGEFDRARISEFSSSLLTTGGVRRKGLSPSTVNTVLLVLKWILDHASRETGCPSISFRKLRVNDRKESAEVLTVADQERLRSYLLEHPSPCNLGAFLCLSFGLRIGEICALRWSDVRLDEGVLSVGRSMTRRQTFAEKGKKTEIVISSPKSASSERKIPLTSEHVAFLMQYRCEDGAYVLTGDSTRYMEPRAMSNRFHAILEACDIRPIKFHSLRHSFATRWIELQQDVKSLSEILGHSSVNVTLNYYVHPSLESKRQSVSNFSKIAFPNRKQRKS